MSLRDLNHDEWIEGMGIGDYDVVSGWLPLVDPAKFNRAIDDLAGLGLSAIASAHSPVLHDTLTDQAIERLRQLPASELPPPPGQSVLDEIIAATATPN